LPSSCSASAANGGNSSAPASPLGGIVGGILGAAYQIWLLVCVLHWAGCIDAPLVETLMCFPYCCCYPCCCRELYSNRRKVREGKLGGRTNEGFGEVVVTQQPSGFTAAYPHQQGQQQPPPPGYAASYPQQPPPPGYAASYPQQPSHGRSLTSKW
jgi:hypothetical protein